MKISKISIILILLIASLFRLVLLDKNPPHLTPDEAALGYNAYSILKTGRDEHGVFLPIVFKSFGDYKPGLYIYTLVPVIASLGLSDFAIRLPSSISGIASVYLIFLIFNQVFPNKGLKIGKTTISLSLIAAILTAINPLHVHFSRGAWEANISFTLTLGGIYFFIRALKNPMYFYLSAFSFSCTLWMYQGAKLSTPLVLLALLISHRQQLRINAELVKSSLLMIILATPILLSLKYGSGRLRVFSVFSYPRPEAEISQTLLQDNTSEKGWIYYVFHPESLSFARGILERYFNYFSGKFLFFEGDWSHPLHATPYHGALYMIEIVFLAAGIIYIIHNPSPFNSLIILLLVFSPIPAALSRDSISVVRSLNIIFPLVSIISLGLFEILNYSEKLKKFISILVISIYVILIMRFIDLEFIHNPKLFGKHYSYGYKQLVETISPIRTKYVEIIVDQSYSQPYIYFLLYEKYDPRKWWPQIKTSNNPNGDVNLVGKFENVTFRPLAWSGDKEKQNTLVAGGPLAMDPKAKTDSSVKLVKEILNPDGSTAFYIFEAI